MYRFLLALLEIARGPIRRYRIRQFWKHAPRDTQVRVHFNNWGGIQYLELNPLDDEGDDSWGNSPGENTGGGACL